MKRKTPPTRFLATANLVYQFQVETKQVFRLNFTGYQETILAYQRVQDTEMDDLFALSKDFLAWHNYFNEILSLTNLWVYQKEMERDAHKGRIPPRRKKKEIFAVNELKRLETELKLLKQFQGQVMVQNQFFINAHYVLRRMYREAVKRYQKYEY